MIVTMASISIPQLSSFPSHLSSSGASRCGKELSDLEVPASLSNLPFVFPASDSSPSAHVAEPLSRALPPPLPAFSFNPGGSPNQSTHTHPSQPRSSAGHCRRPSELINVDASTTPGESILPVPPSLPSPGFSSTGPGRRGHAHRRSAAISSVDLSALQRANLAISIGGSAPCTPADVKQNRGFIDEIPRPMSRSVTSLNEATPPVTPDKPTMVTGDGSVGDNFGSDNTVTVLPISIISSETTSSLSTIRPNVTRVNNLPPNTSQSLSLSPLRQARPKTADPALSLAKSGVPGFIESAHLKRPVSVPDSLQSFRESSSNTPEIKRKKPFWDDRRWKESCKRNSLDGESPDNVIIPSTVDSGSTPTSNPRPSVENRSQKLLKTRKKQRKMRFWVDTIFPLKGKRHYSKKAMQRRSPTPPPSLKRTGSNVGSICDVDLDDDKIVIIRTPTTTDVPKPHLSTSIDSVFEHSWKPRSYYEQGVENDPFSPIIDLDAALGPFNTPEMSSNRVAGSAFSVATRRMYSGGRRGEFVGPEMRYHRRAESAPEMPPFDRSGLGNNRFSSNPTMVNDDVFYEEEEDAFLAGNNSSIADEETTQFLDTDSGPGNNLKVLIPFVPAISLMPTDRALCGMPRKSLPFQTTVTDGASTSRSDIGTAATVDTAVHEYLVTGPRMAVEPACQPKKSVEIVESDDWQSQPPNAPSSNVSPHFLAVDKHPCSSPMDFTYATQLPLSFDRLPSSSTFPSPDLSNASFEVPRSAAASSITDQTGYHDQLHGSSEDVPSLTSSVSTATNHRPRFSASFYARSSEDRSASFSTPVLRRSFHSNTEKRSSLVSLSRLVSGSHGEKSKLSQEEKPPMEETEKTKKKGHRISRLIQFWKTKEKSSVKKDAI